MKEGVCVIKRIILIAVNALLLIAFIVCISLSASLVTPLRSQQAAAAWAGQSGERFSQLSAFFPESHSFDSNSIRSLYTSIDSALLSASLESTQYRTLYTDAWSGTINVTIYDERSPVSAKAIAVGGDYFLFHPLYLRSGGYISPNDVMKDRVVLDEELAWRLFGSADLTGFEIMIEDRPFTIAGVISREKDFASSKAYTDGAGLFMSFDAAMILSDNEVSINCYEIVMPDPISGFALNALTEAISDDSVHIVENSTRFSLSNSFSAIRSYGEQSMRMDTIGYPYWENAARYTENLLALLLALALIFIAFPLVCGVVYLVKVIRFLIKRGKRTAKKAVDKHDKRMYDKYMLEHGQKQVDDEENYSVDDILAQAQEPVDDEENYSVAEIIREVQES